MWIDRLISGDIKKAVASRPVVLLTGARQTGKSSVLRNLFPNAEYVTLDHIQVALAADEDPKRFFGGYSSQTVLDEIQYAPGLLRELKIIVDSNRQSYGKWILTGSQRFVLMKNISESLAGRIGLLHLETLSAKELRDSPVKFEKDPEVFLWKGGYPELWANRRIDVSNFFEDYIQTYLERDLNEIIRVSNLRDFRRFITACAARAGQLVNYADIAKDTGVSANTIRQWVNVLEASGIVVLLQPWFGNVNKRLTKSPKLYFCDNGLLCHLLNITDGGVFFDHPLRGNLWENFVFTEYLKTTRHRPGRQLFFYRDHSGVEIDFLIESGGETTLVEAKSSQNIDGRKLNFSKVRGLFGKRKVNCVVACNMKEEKPLKFKDFEAVNPLLCGV